MIQADRIPPPDRYRFPETAVLEDGIMELGG